MSGCSMPARAADESARFHVIAGCRPGFREEPPEADLQLAKGCQVAQQTDRFPAFVLHEDLKVVLQVLSHSGEVEARRDAETGEAVGRRRCRRAAAPGAS